MKGVGFLRLLRRFTDKLGMLLALEEERQALWCPVGFGLGAASYVGLRAEPPPWLAPMLLGLILGFWLVWRRFAARVGTVPGVALLCCALGLFGAGFCAAEIQTYAHATPHLHYPLKNTAVAGVIEGIEPVPAGLRLVIVADTIAGLWRGFLPMRVRVTVRHWPGDLAIGAAVTLKADLFVVDAPVIPGGYDGQRQAWFLGIGAVGYGSNLAVQERPEAGSGRWDGLDRLRNQITHTIATALPGDIGAIAGAIITGERGALSGAVADTYRDSGLAHLLVIAGLHMSFVTGLIFWGLRLVLAAVPWINVRIDSKKTAVVGALLGALIYLLLSGAPVPTTRAFIMVSLAGLAVLTDRLVMSMRSLAVAASVLLCLNPVAVAGVGFQMSFAAVTGLVAFYESVRRPRLGAGGGGVMRRIGRHGAGLALTSVIATAATAGFTLWSFNRVPLLSVAANLLAVPIMGLWVMPWAIVTCIFLPFGAHPYGLAPMGWGIGWINRIAALTSAAPFATLALPTPPDWGLSALIAGGLWVVIWRRRWRHIGWIGFVAAGISLWFVQTPDLLIAGDGRLIAVKQDAGHYLVSSGTAPYTAKIWAQATAADFPVGSYPQTGHEVGDLRCDAAGCILRREGRIIALVKDWPAINEDCGLADLVVVPFTVPGGCGTRAALIDRRSLRASGAVAVYVGRDGVRIDTVRSRQGKRPWTVIERPAPPHLLNSAGSDPRDGLEP